jgi:hypothetical protein
VTFLLYLWLVLVTLRIYLWDWLKHALNLPISLLREMWDCFCDWWKDRPTWGRSVSASTFDRSRK